MDKNLPASAREMGSILVQEQELNKLYLLTALKALGSGKIGMRVEFTWRLQLTLGGKSLPLCAQVIVYGGETMLDDVVWKLCGLS